MEWQLKQKNLKHYPHFDSEISLEDAVLLIDDPASVSKHSFYPLLYYNKGWNKRAPKGQKGEPKNRPIRYAARRDSYIFSKYRSILSANYENKLQELGLCNTVLAYRKISSAKGSGKCNIDFAKDAFDKIKSLEDCVVVALDISKFFESLDHERIKAVWCKCLGVHRLPSDHHQVFKAITQYSYIDRELLYKELGIIGNIVNPKNGSVSIGYLVDYDKMPKPQICKPQKLRELVSKNKDLIEKHKKKSFGIPQGVPISDLLANMYLLDFDTALQSYVHLRDGFYCRYSDDILIVLPGSVGAGKEVKEFAISEIVKLGSEIKIKDQKTYVYTFRKTKFDHLDFTREIGPSNSGANGLEYLGFRFDGRKVFIRDATMSNLWRKVSKSANRFAVQSVKRYKGKSISDLKQAVDINKFSEKFGRVQSFEDLEINPRNWTFWT